MNRFFDVHGRELQPGHTVIYSASDGRSSSRVRKAMVIRFTKSRVTLQPLDGNIGYRHRYNRDFTHPEFEPSGLTNVGGAARVMRDSNRQVIPNFKKLNNVMIVDGSGWHELDYFENNGFLPV